MKNPVQIVWLKPARKGLLVPYPGRNRRHLSPDGDRVRLSSWWKARLRDGDAIEIDETETAKAPTAAKAKNK